MTDEIIELVEDRLGYELSDDCRAKIAEIIAGLPDIEPSDSVVEQLADAVLKAPKSGIEYIEGYAV